MVACCRDSLPNTSNNKTSNEKSANRIKAFDENAISKNSKEYTLQSEC